MPVRARIPRIRNERKVIRNVPSAPPTAHPQTASALTSAGAAFFAGPPAGFSIGSHGRFKAHLFKGEPSFQIGVGGGGGSFAPLSTPSIGDCLSKSLPQPHS
jgi:hypothetical protein